MSGHTGPVAKDKKTKRKRRQDKRVPIEKVLPGLKSHPLDPDLSPTYAYVVIKSVDADGTDCWSYRTTSRLDEHELHGMLTMQTEIHRALLLEEWTDED